MARVRGITVLPATRLSTNGMNHICLYSVSIHQMASPRRVAHIRLQLICRPRKDERLSWPSWLTL